VYIYIIIKSVVSYDISLILRYRPNPAHASATRFCLTVVSFPSPTRLLCARGRIFIPATAQRRAQTKQHLIMPSLRGIKWHSRDQARVPVLLQKQRCFSGDQAPRHLLLAATNNVKLPDQVSKIEMIFIHQFLYLH
jgi:hypothetical protein